MYLRRTGVARYFLSGQQGTAARDGVLADIGRGARTRAATRRSAHAALTPRAASGVKPGARSQGKVFSNIDFSRLYSLLARQWGCFERIDAFEPDPVNYAQMTAQFFLNDAVLDIVSHKIAFSELHGRWRRGRPAGHLHKPDFSALTGTVC